MIDGNVISKSAFRGTRRLPKWRFFAEGRIKHSGRSDSASRGSVQPLQSRQPARPRADDLRRHDDGESDVRSARQRRHGDQRAAEPRQHRSAAHGAVSGADISSNQLRVFQLPASSWRGLRTPASISIQQLTGSLQPAFIWLSGDSAIQSCGALLPSVGARSSRSRRPRIKPASPRPSAFTLQSALADGEEHNRTLIAARLGRAADLAGIDVAKQRPNPRRRSKRGATRRTKRSASVCRSNSAASARAGSISRTRRWRERRPRSASCRRSTSGERCGSRTSNWWRRPTACRSRPSCAGSPSGLAMPRAIALNRARRRGSRRCRPSWRWRRPTTSRKRRAAGSTRRAPS